MVMMMAAPVGTAAGVSEKLAGELWSESSSSTLTVDKLHQHPSVSSSPVKGCRGQEVIPESSATCWVDPGAASCQ